jgi:hypothetical protein
MEFSTWSFQPFDCGATTQQCTPSRESKKQGRHKSKIRTQYLMKLFALPYLAIVLVLCACSSGGSSNSSAQSHEQPQNPPLSILNILVPEAAAAQPLNGYTVSISVAGDGYRQQKVADSHGEASFPDIPAGKYLVTVVVRSGSFELSTEYHETIIGAETKKESISITLPRSDLQVGVNLKTEPARVQGVYHGQSRTIPYCFENEFLSGFGYATATTAVNMSSGDIRINAEIFSGLTIEFTGTYTDDGEQVEASGTYRSSDFKEGTWVLEGIAEPKARALFLDIRTEGDCETTLDLIGLKP